MDKIITCLIIAAFVSLAIPFFLKGRNFYFFSFLVMLVGAIIAFWANSRSYIDPSGYTRHDAFIERAIFDREEGELVIFAEGKELVLSKQNLSIDDLAVVEEAVPELTGNATIWLQADSNLIAGLNAPSLSIDPKAFAKREALLYSRIRNVGFVISGIGLCLVLLSYLTRSVNTDILLTQKY